MCISRLRANISSVEKRFSHVIAEKSFVIIESMSFLHRGVKVHDNAWRRLSLRESGNSRWNVSIESFGVLTEYTSISEDKDRKFHCGLPGGNTVGVKRRRVIPTRLESREMFNKRLMQHLLCEYPTILVTKPTER